MLGKPSCETRNTVTSGVIQFRSKHGVRGESESEPNVSPGAAWSLTCVHDEENKAAGLSRACRARFLPSLTRHGEPFADELRSPHCKKQNKKRSSPPGPKTRNSIERLSNWLRKRGIELEESCGTTIAANGAHGNGPPRAAANVNGQSGSQLGPSVLFSKGAVTRCRSERTART